MSTREEGKHIPLLRCGLKWHRSLKLDQLLLTSTMHAATLVVSTIAGSVAFLNMLVVPTAIVFWKRHLRLEAMMTMGVSWTSALVRTLLKRAIARPRPHPLLVRRTKRSFGESFPSGQVASALNFWGWLFALGMILLKGSRWWQKGMLSLPVLFVLLVGPARIYLGDHWSTDVLGGYLFGGGWLGLSLRLYLKLRTRDDEPFRQRSRPGRILS
jgi:membrane-associated phospholipid phosphatase